MKSRPPQGMPRVAGPSAPGSNASSDAMDAVGRRAIAAAAVRPPPLPQRRAGASGNHRLPPRVDAAPKSQPWQMAEPYKLVRPLAFGGLTYEAAHVTSGRRLFVRLYPDVEQLDDLVRRFAVPSQLTCPHTVRVVDIGIADLPVPLGYVISEFVDGPSLQAVLEERKMLAPHVALRLVTQVLSALEEAHRFGLAHGKICPDHVLLGRGTLGEPVAKLCGFDDVVARSSSAPALDAIARDIHDAAALFCQCLFGRTFEAHERDELVALAKVTAGLPELLVSALQWGAFQFQSVTQFGSALAALSGPLRGNGKRRVVSVLDSGSVNAADSVRDLFPSRQHESAARPLTIWVLADDPALSSRASAIALDELASVCELRYLNEEEQTAIRDPLSRGEIHLPWVVLFGEAHVRRNEPLLALLSSCRELTHLLVCPGPDADLLRRAAKFCGVDGCVALPMRADDLTREVVRLTERTRTKSRGYDKLRRDLRCTLDEVGELSRAAAAEDVAEVPSSRTWSVRVPEAYRNTR